MGRLIERIIFGLVLFGGLAIAAPSGTINYSAINGVTGILQLCANDGRFSQGSAAG